MFRSCSLLCSRWAAIVLVAFARGGDGMSLEGDVSSASRGALCRCTADTCGWQQPEECVPWYVYAGQNFTGCTTVKHHGKGWCSHDLIYQDQWSNCSMKCPSGCQWEQGGQCVPQGDSERYKVKGIVEADKFKIPSSQSECSCTADTCNWLLPEVCSPRFEYMGITYEGCTTANNSGQAWCSHDTAYKGSWSTCPLNCPLGCHWKRPAQCVRVGQADQSHSELVKTEDIEKPYVVRIRIPSAQSECPCTPDTCNFLPPTDCSPRFEYKNITYEGCTSVGNNNGQAWCSRDSVYEGFWNSCPLICPPGCEWKLPGQCVRLELADYSYLEQNKKKDVTTPHAIRIPSSQSECPCTADTCKWSLPADCSQIYEYKNSTYEGCTTAGSEGQAWCSHDRTYKGFWSLCPLSCPLGCLWEQPAQCVREGHADGRQSERYRIEDITEVDAIKIPSSQSECPCTPDTCNFLPPKDCLPKYQYKGITYAGCTTANNSGHAWCSHDMVYNGFRSACPLNCPPGCDWKRPAQCVRVGLAEDRHSELFKTEDITKPVGIRIPSSQSECPCTADTCMWSLPEDCVPRYEYKGIIYQGCTTVNSSGKAWCSHDTTYKGFWSACPLKCPSGCDWLRPDQCVRVNRTENTWFLRTGMYQTMKTQEPLDSGFAHINCWRPNPQCAPEFTYKGNRFTGCTTDGWPKGWCSWNAEYVKDQWNTCEPCCDPGISPASAILMSVCSSVAGAAAMGVLVLVYFTNKRKDMREMPWSRITSPPSSEASGGEYFL